jgi:O-methyltransferase involved in polyketide biosynthesis
LTADLDVDLRVPAVPSECRPPAEDFLERLVTAGFDASRPAVIVWEGVTMYLPEAAIRRNARTIATACDARTVLLFDHMPAPTRTAASKARHAFVAKLGESFGWGTNDALPLLFDEGFRHVRSASFDELCLSLTGTYERARGFSKRHMVLASRASLFGP